MPERLRLVCATANPGKVAELADLLAPVADLLERPESVGPVVEDAGTLVGNARLKAAAIQAVLTDDRYAALADDTGLEVDALDGRPGVDSAVFAGADADDAANRHRLLHELAAVVPMAQRSARFRTVMVVRWPSGRELIAEGVCEGWIATSERGERGFGYDPVFIPADGDGRTFAEMSLADKQMISHRRRALDALLNLLADDV